MKYGDLVRLKLGRSIAASRGPMIVLGIKKNEHDDDGQSTNVVKALANDGNIEFFYDWQLEVLQTYAIESDDDT